MRILFLPLARGQSGTTTTSILTSMFMALRYNKDVAYVPITDNLTTVQRYLSLESVVNTDISRTVSQMYKLVTLGEASAQEIRAYAIPTIRNMDLFNINDVSASADDLLAIQKYVLLNMPYEFTFIELEVPLDSSSALAAIAAADIVICVGNQNSHVLARIQDIRESELFEEKHLMCIINNYNAVIANQDTILKDKTLPHRETAFIHYNPFIPKMFNKGDVISLIEQINLENGLVSELASDLCVICDMLCLHQGNPTSGKKKRKSKAFSFGGFLR